MSKKIIYTKQLEEWTKSLSIKQFNEFSELFKEMFNENDLKLIKKIYSNKEMVFTNQNELLVKNKEMQDLYSNEITKTIFVLKSDDVLKQINGAKIFVSGPTGTGKTTLIKEIIDNSGINFIDIEFESLISSKMGQTQINLMNLVSELNSKKEKNIIFIDEIDSIITNREASDLGEHSRIVATFLKFLDKINNNIILFVSTNHSHKIDSAILRRFQIKIETNYFDISKFFEILKNNNFKISTQKINFYKKIILKEEDKFNISDVKRTLDESYLYAKMNDKKFENFDIILFLFANKFMKKHEKTLNKSKIKSKNE